MSGISISNRFQKHGSVSLFEQCLFTTDGIGHGQWIVSVHTLGMHRIRINSRTNTGKKVKGHGFTGCLSAHAVEIIHEIKNDGQSALH